MISLPSPRRARFGRRPKESIRPAMPRPERRDCHGQLLAALEAMIGPAGMIGQASMRPWCSATFLGAQHRILLRIEGDGAAREAAALAARLPDAEFTLRGHIVADVAIDDLGPASDDVVVITLAVLTIEDW